MERAPPPAPTGLANYQDMMRMVFTSMAGRRLLPKEGWGLNRAIRDTAAPTVSVHVKRAPLKADSTSCTILHGLLEDSARRLVVKLTMEGDFTSVQERPLSLPPSLVSLYLNGFRGELCPAPAGLQVLCLQAYRMGEGDATIPHPLLKDLTDGDAVQCFVRELSEIIAAMLPTLTHLVLDGLNEDDSGDPISLRSCMQALIQLPRPHLQELIFRGWIVHWEDLLPLLSPAVVDIMIQSCFFDSAVVSDMLTLPPLPEGLSSLTVNGCYCDSSRLVFSGIPESLRRLDVTMSPTDVQFREPLPPLLDCLRGDASVSGSMLPPGLRELDLVAFPQLDELPPGLRFLKLRNHDHPLPPLPDTLETLVLDNCTHHVANIPDSVRSLSLYWLPPNPAPPLPTRWPAHLERLMYWAKSDGAPMPVIKRLPPTLRELALNGCEVHASLPRTLQKVRLGRNFTQQLTFTGRVTVNSNDNWYF